MWHNEAARDYSLAVFFRLTNWFVMNKSVEREVS